MSEIIDNFEMFEKKKKLESSLLNYSSNLESFSYLIGLDLKKAEKKLKDKWTIRKQIEDGKKLIGTIEFRSDRINVETKDNKIIKILNIG